MKNLLTLVVLLLLSANVYSQTDKLTVKGKITDTSSIGLGAVKIDVFQDGKLLQTLTTASNGMYKIDSLALEHVYQLHFSKEGYCYKFAELIMKSTTEKKMEGTFPMEVNTSLFLVNKKKAKKLKFLKTEPTAKAQYNSEIDNVEWDIPYIQSMKAKIDPIIKK